MCECFLPNSTGPIIFPESQEARQQQQQQQEQQRRVVSHIFNQQAIVTPQYQRISLTRKPKKLQRFTTTDELEVPRILAALANHARRVQNNEFQQKSYAPTLQHYNNRIDDDHQHGDHEAESTTIEKKQYNFAYAVKDRQSGDGYSHTQKQENGAVQGSYKVRLPDNRIQITKYIADDNGYRADVTYEDDPQPQEAPVQVQATPQYYSPPQQQQHQQHNNNNKAIRYTVTPTPNREYIHAPTIRKYYPSTTDIPNAYY